MPYITPEQRIFCDVTLGDYQRAEHPGELNFQITGLVREFIEEHGQNYRTYNSAIGVLECAKLELYRRMVAPYEDTKKEENGDVY